MKLHRYSAHIPFVCNTCGEEFDIEGYYEPDGRGDVVIVPAVRGGLVCPNDLGVEYRYFDNDPPRKIPTHDVNWTGETR